MDKIKQEYYCVYKHTNLINNKVYIGQTKNFSNRCGKDGSGYLAKTNGEFNQPLFARAILKYGWDNFTHEILKEELTKEEADYWETYFIKKYESINPNKGYNIRLGGSHGSLSEKTKNKLRDKMKGKYDGEHNPFYGRKHTAETKEKIGKKNKEHSNNRDITGEKNPNWGNYKKRPFKERGSMNEDTKKKISESNKGYYKNHPHHSKGVKKTDQQKQYMRQKMLGRQMNEEWREKIGRGHSPYVYICVETGIKYYSSAEAMRQTGIDKSSIRRAADGIQKTAGGFHWTKIKL